MRKIVGILLAIFVSFLAETSFGLTVGFEELSALDSNTGATEIGQTYTNSGYQLSAFNRYGTEPFRFVVINDTSWSNPPDGPYYAGSTALVNAYYMGLTSLTRLDGQTFDLLSMACSEVRQDTLDSLQPASFEGIKADGTIVRQDFTFDRVHGFETFILSGFNNLVSASWHVDGQFDDIILQQSNSTPEPAIIDIDPDTLNLKSKGKWVTCYIEFPEEYDVADIEVSTVAITSISAVGGDATEINIPAEPFPTEIGDYNDNGILDLMVKFDRQLVQDVVPVGAVEITVSGSTIGEVDFQGTDTLLIIDKGREHIDDKNHGSVVY